MTVEVKEETFELVCDDCESNLSFSWSDVCYRSYLLQHYIECPLCGHETEVAPSCTTGEAIRFIRDRCTKKDSHPLKNG